MRALFDTAVLEGYVMGSLDAKRAIDAYEHPMVSAMSAATLLAAAKPEEWSVLRAWLSRFEWVNVDGEVAELAAKLMHHHGVEQQHAITWASAKAHKVLFVTDDPTRYPLDEVGVKKAY